MSDKIKKADPVEVNSAQELSRTLLLLATSTTPHIGLTSLIMATSVAAASLGVPLENICSLFDRTANDVYEANARIKN